MMERPFVRELSLGVIGPLSESQPRSESSFDGIQF